ncbi:MAG: M28 family metallopeptidase [Planctomycetes bacterium]|jgi:hypothetical protein|nr:M28 family metallopeptidase [Planctomycetota bacterium]
MTRKFNYRKFIESFTALSERQLTQERLAANLIVKVLKSRQIDYKLEPFTVAIPWIKKASLQMNGQAIECRGCGFRSGKLKGWFKLINALAVKNSKLYYPNLCFSPACRSISRPVFFFAPALAISRTQAEKIGQSVVSGEIKVQRVKHRSLNILVGNRQNPASVCFAHYDSIGPGAIDNAAAVAVMLKAIIADKFDLANSLCIFTAAEELSYEQPIYWGYGFRVWEKAHRPIMSRAKRLIVLDGIGNGATQIIKNRQIIFEAFPIKGFKSYQNKIYLLTGDFKRLMAVYHSDLDDGRQIKVKYLDEAEKKLVSLTKF